MKEYTVKEMKLLKANPYTFKVTKNKLYFTIEFKETFWTAYQAGISPRKILTDLGYDVTMFGQKQIDSMVQSMKRQAESGPWQRVHFNFISQDKTKRLEYEAREKAIRDYNQLMYEAEERGVQQGIQQTLLKQIQKKMKKNKTIEQIAERL